MYTISKQGLQDILNATKVADKKLRFYGAVVEAEELIQAISRLQTVPQKSLIFEVPEATYDYLYRTLFPQDQVQKCHIQVTGSDSRVLSIYPGSDIPLVSSAAAAAKSTATPMVKEHKRGEV